ncbi:hypothetical protein, conserved [Eimeria brunetti]|uniref:Uncharacterized protein n=1 Tax=Eimeria brunetti TaxID=51314 RepID=U6LI02_9EIME|nr:hypothetical protein, conserved [Eimeria brunetti]
MDRLGKLRNLHFGGKASTVTFAMGGVVVTVGFREHRTGFVTSGPSKEVNRAADAALLFAEVSSTWDFDRMARGLSTVFCGWLRAAVKGYMRGSQSEEEFYLQEKGIDDAGCQVSIRITCGCSLVPYLAGVLSLQGGKTDARPDAPGSHFDGSGAGPFGKGGHGEVFEFPDIAGLPRGSSAALAETPSSDGDDRLPSGAPQPSQGQSSSEDDAGDADRDSDQQGPRPTKPKTPCGQEDQKQPQEYGDRGQVPWQQDMRRRGLHLPITEATWLEALDEEAENTGETPAGKDEKRAQKPSPTAETHDAAGAGSKDGKSSSAKHGAIPKHEDPAKKDKPKGTLGKFLNPADKWMRRRRASLRYGFSLIEDESARQTLQTFLYGVAVMCSPSRALRTKSARFSYRGIDVEVTVRELLAREAGFELERAFVGAIEEVERLLPGKSNTIAEASTVVASRFLCSRMALTLLQQKRAT